MLAARCTGPRFDHTYDLHAILPLSGPGAFLGTHIAKSYEIIEKLVNASGGIHGRPLRFVIADDGTSPQTAVQLAAPLIAANVPVFLGPAIGGRAVRSLSSSRRARPSSTAYRR